MALAACLHNTVNTRDRQVKPHKPVRVILLLALRSVAPGGGQGGRSPTENARGLELELRVYFCSLFGAQTLIFDLFGSLDFDFLFF